VQVDGQARGGGHAGPDLPRQLDRIQREALVGPARVDPEARRAPAGHPGAGLLDGRRPDGLDVGGHGARDRERHQPEHPFEPPRGLVRVGGRQPHQHPPVGRLHSRAGDSPQGRTHVVDQHPLESLAVAALEEDLAVPAEEHALHLARFYDRLRAAAISWRP